MARYKSVELLTRAYKHSSGKIKGKNKKETKLLKLGCTHHIYNKKGRLKAQIRNNGDGTCACRMCKHNFPTKLASPNTIEESVGGVQKYVDQAKFLNIAIDGGTEADKFLVDYAIMTGQFPKVYSKIAKIANKRDTVKKKKKNRSAATSSLGSWGPRR